MKGRSKKILLATAVMLTALTAGALSACTMGDQEAQKKSEGYIHTVTYDANGGTFGSTTSLTYALVGENSIAPAPGYQDGQGDKVVVPTRKDHQLTGETDLDNDATKTTNEEALLSKSWYLAQTDEDGNVIYEGEGENRKPLLASTKPWNFKTDRVTGDITLVAQWKEVFRYLLCITTTDENNQEKEEQLRSYVVDEGATIADKLYDKKDGQLFERADYIRVTESKYTLLGFYMDKALTQQLNLAYTHPGCVDDTNNVKIYAKYLEGKYTFISNDSKKCKYNDKQISKTKNWYLVEDTDMSTEPNIWTALDEFNGTIYGNGFALQNLKVKAEAVKDKLTHSIFGKVNGKIENLKLENVTLEVEVGTARSQNYQLGFFGNSLGTTGSVNEVTVEDCKVVVKGYANVASYGCSINVTAMSGTPVWITAPAQTGVTVKENGVSKETVSTEEQ